IMGYDQVMVMECGKVIEMGPPLELLENEHSAFHAMCQDTGEFELLKLLAQSAKALAESQSDPKKSKFSRI
ncbi:hypothetical protein EV182_003495, partial [Spiromyces aspiralis]